MTPLQLAIKLENIEMVKKLTSSAIPDLGYLDCKGSSIFHYAALTSKEIISILTSKSKVNLDQCNKFGHTPLYVALLNQNEECAQALKIAGADVNCPMKSSRKCNNFFEFLC